MSGAFNLTEPQDGSSSFGTGAPVATGAELEGDTYINLANGNAYVFTAGAWVLQGAIAAASEWTTQIIAATQTTSAAGAQDITDLPGFAPVANAVYEIEAKLIVATTATATGCRPSIAVPTGIDDLAYELRSSGATLAADTIQWGGPAATLLQPSHVAANVGYLARLEAVVSVGATPGVGNVRPRFNSETGGTSVQVRRGSMFRWRRVL